MLRFVREILGLAAVAALFLHLHSIDSSLPVLLAVLILVLPVDDED